MTKKENLNTLIANINSEMTNIDAQSISPLGLNDSKAFEYCILLLLIDSLDSIDGVSEILPCKLDPQTQRFRVPGSPRLFYSDFSYYSFRYKSSYYEVHLGAQYKGDTTRHEADVSIIKKEQADNSRSTSTSPKKDSLVALFECKYYTGSLKIAQARELVGLKEDLLRDGIYYFVSNSFGESTKDYFSKPKRPDLYECLTFSNNDNSLKIFKENIKKQIEKRLTYYEIN